MRTDKFIVKQKDGKLNIYAGTKLIEAFLDNPFAESNPLLEVTQKAFKPQFDAYFILHKSALVLLHFECTPRQARWIFTYASAAEWPDLAALPVDFDKTAPPIAKLDSWLRLVELFEVRDGISRGEEMLNDLLAWTQWSDEDLNALLGDDEKSAELGQFHAAFPDHYAGAALLVRLRDCFALLDRTGL